MVNKSVLINFSPGSLCLRGLHNWKIATFLYFVAIFSLENGLVTADGTKILTVEEYNRFINASPESMKAIFEINTITGLRYIEHQKLYENPQWYYKERNQIILSKEAQKKEKQKLPKRTIDKLPAAFSYSQEAK